MKNPKEHKKLNIIFWVLNGLTFLILMWDYYLLSTDRILIVQRFLPIRTTYVAMLLFVMSFGVKNILFGRYGVLNSSISTIVMIGLVISFIAMSGDVYPYNESIEYIDSPSHTVLIMEGDHFIYLTPYKVYYVDNNYSASEIASYTINDNETVAYQIVDDNLIIDICIDNLCTTEAIPLD